MDRCVAWIQRHGQGCIGSTGKTEHVLRKDLQTISVVRREPERLQIVGIISEAKLIAGPSPTGKGISFREIHRDEIARLNRKTDRRLIERLACKCSDRDWAQF